MGSDTRPLSQFFWVGPGDEANFSLLFHFHIALNETEEQRMGGGTGNEARELRHEDGEP